MRLRRRVSTWEVFCLVCFSVLNRVHHINRDFEKWLLNFFACIAMETYVEFVLSYIFFEFFC